MQFDTLQLCLYRIPLILYIYLHHKAMNGRTENQLFKYKCTQKPTAFHINEQCDTGLNVLDCKWACGVFVHHFVFQSFSNSI